MKLHCIIIELYRIVQKYFTKNNIQYHSYPLLEKRTVKVVIKGLLFDITELEIADELKNKGFEATNVRQFRNSIKKYPIYIVTLKRDPLNKAIFNIHSFLYRFVKIERYISNNPSQCYSYQRSGHSSLHYGNAPRCVKCVGPYLAKDSKKTRKESSKCTNYQGDHTANYKKCWNKIW